MAKSKQAINLGCQKNEDIDYSTNSYVEYCWSLFSLAQGVLAWHRGSAWALGSLALLRLTKVLGPSFVKATLYSSSGFKNNELTSSRH